MLPKWQTTIGSLRVSFSGYLTVFFLSEEVYVKA